MRIQPDLRMSVLAALARALEMKPGEFLEEILKEQKNDRPNPARAKALAAAAKRRTKALTRGRRASLMRRVAS